MRRNGSFFPEKKNALWLPRAEAVQSAKPAGLKYKRPPASSTSAYIGLQGCKPATVCQA